MAYERIIIVGNLGGNPELRTTKDAQQVANFSIAVNRKKGETKTTTWYRVYVKWNTSHHGMLRRLYPIVVVAVSWR